MFETTHWSLVLTAAEGESTDARNALADLCQRYWTPLYGFVRRRGFSVEEAQDLTQGFFAKLIEKDYVGQADRDRGRFRTFLLASLKHFLSHERERQAAQKRGGDRTILSLDFESAEQAYACEPATDVTPEKLFERRWALTVLQQAIESLERDHAEAGRIEEFERYRPFLTGDGDTPSYAQLAAETGKSVEATRVAVHRLRQRFRRSLKAEVSQTVSDPGDAEDELSQLLIALSKK
ncbi:MAG: sigma-70 family RNA polymerase sigma factor [Planctomycetota bacterium]